MKKLLSVICVGVALTGCGGGGSGGGSEGNSTPNPPVVPKEVLFDGSATVYKYNLEGVDTNADKSSLTKRDGIFYINGTNLDHYFSSYLLTQDGLYEPETKASLDSSKGIRYAFIKSTTDTHWVFTPYNFANRKALEITQDYKVIDLNAKTIAPILSPATSAFAVDTKVEKSDYPLASVAVRIFLNGDTFPKDAKCLQNVTQESNKNHLAFEPDNSQTQVQNAKSLQDWANLEFRNGRTGTPNVRIENWGGYNLGVITLNGYDAQGQLQYDFAVDYKGKIFRADPIGGKHAFADYMNIYAKQLLAQGYSQQLVNLVINNFKNSCIFYNEAAAKAIDQAILKAQQK